LFFSFFWDIHFIAPISLNNEIASKERIKNMGWANLSISSEISKIENIAKEIKTKNAKVSEALSAIAKALKEIESSMDRIAYLANQ